MLTKYEVHLSAERMHCSSPLSEISHFPVEHVSHVIGSNVFDSEGNEIAGARSVENGYTICELFASY